MITKGISIAGETLVDAPNHGASLEQDGAAADNFSALLFLLLATPAPAAPLTDAAEACAPACEEGSAASEASYASGSLGVERALINPSTGDGLGGPNTAIELSPDRFVRTTFTAVSAAMRQSIPPQPKPALGDPIKATIASDSGKDDQGGLLSAPQDRRSWSNNRLLEVPGFDGTAVTQTPDIVQPAPVFPSDADVINFPPRNPSSEIPPIEIAAGSHQPPDPTIFQSARELQLFGEAQEKDNQALSAYSHSSALVSTVQAEDAMLKEGSKLVQRPRLQVESEPQGLVPAGIGEMGREIQPPHARPSEAYASQYSDGELFPEPFQNTEETPVETAPPGDLFSQVVHTKDITPARTAREAQGVDWRPVIDRVAGEISGRIYIGKQEAVLQLDPPELGKVQIDIQMDGDKLAVRIRTETQESRTLLETHLPELRQALGEFRVELVEVRIDSGGWTGSGGDGQQEQRQETNGGHQTAHDFNSARPGNSEEGEPARRTPPVHERVSMWA